MEFSPQRLTTIDMVSLNPADGFPFRFSSVLAQIGKKRHTGKRRVRLRNLHVKINAKESFKGAARDLLFNCRSISRRAL